MKKNRINPFFLIGGLVAITLGVVLLSIRAAGVCDNFDLAIVSLTILLGFCPLYVVLGLNAKSTEAQS
ncbi:MAG: DUF2892 domain-containing protein [Bacteroidota bacterium]|nr:DUF2892 domain-containing protein [Bacteroidota bacterium]